MDHKVGLGHLPVELLYEIQIHALSESLPLVSHHLHAVFALTTTSYRARYIIARVRSPWDCGRTLIITRALRYGICTQDVLEALFRIFASNGLPAPHHWERCELPRRLFRALTPKAAKDLWGDDEYPLPFLRHLHNHPEIPPLDPNLNGGYALTKAVHARFLPLIQFLLDHGASPSKKNNLAITVAIRQNDLTLVKLLVEREEKAVDKTVKAKKRKLADRVEVTPSMLKTAVRCAAHDIVGYLLREKNVVPDMQTLHMMTN